MSFGRSNRATLSLLELEGRCNPAKFFVTNNLWPAPNPNVPPPVGSFQEAMSLAANNPGQDEIEIVWASPQVGNTPTFTVLPGRGITVPEGVVIQAGTGNVFAKFTGETPFKFTHTAPAGAAGTGKQSEIIGGVFDTCAVPNANTYAGGALVVTAGQVRTVNTRFTNNTARDSGAIMVKEDATLVLDGDPTKPNADPSGNTPFENTASRTIFRMNHANHGGGAVDAEGTVILKRVWFKENDAPHAGAISVTGAGILKTQVPPAARKRMPPFTGTRRPGSSGGAGPSCSTRGP